MSKSKKERTVVAIDLGYGYVKALKKLKGKPIIFPSLVSPGVTDFDSALTEAKKIFDVDGQPYFIGQVTSALSQPAISRARVGSPEFKALSWLGFVSNATAKTTYYLDNIQLVNNADE